jgi:hypothetical protein
VSRYMNERAMFATLSRLVLVVDRSPYLAHALAAIGPIGRFESVTEIGYREARQVWESERLSRAFADARAAIERVIGSCEAQKPARARTVAIEAVGARRALVHSLARSRRSVPAGDTSRVAVGSQHVHVQVGADVLAIPVAELDDFIRDVGEARARIVRSRGPASTWSPVRRPARRDGGRGSK